MDGDEKTIRQMILDAMEPYDETMSHIVAISPKDLNLLRTIDTGYGAPECPNFCLWTVGRVYFPHDYDGADYILSAPRNPCDEKLGCYEEWHNDDEDM